MNFSKLFAILLVISAPLSSTQAQEKNSENFRSIFGGDGRITGWYVGLTSNFTTCYNKNVVMPSIEGGIVIGANTTLGLKAVALSSYEEQLKVAATETVEASYLTGGYAGFAFEPRLAPMSGVHLSFPCMVGAGAMTLLSRNRYSGWDEDEWDESRKTLEAEPFFIVEPGVSLEINLTRFMRLSGGVSYRFTSGRDMLMVKQSHISGAAANVSLKFGKFSK